MSALGAPLAFPLGGGGADTPAAAKPVDHVKIALSRVCDQFKSADSPRGPSS
jgi:hypothetical protein